MAKFITTMYKPGGGNLRLVIKPSEPIFQGGRRIGARPGVYADFKNGVFETKNEQIIDRLRGSSSFGRDFTEVKQEDEKFVPAQNDKSETEKMRDAGKAPVEIKKNEAEDTGGEGTSDGEEVNDEYTTMTRPQLMKEANTQKLKTENTMTADALRELLRNKNS